MHMIWAKSTYRNDSRRNPAVAGFWPIRERIRAVAGYPASIWLIRLFNTFTICTKKRVLTELAAVFKTKLLDVEYNFHY